MMNSKIQKAEDGKNAGSAKKSVQTGKKVADKKEANKKQAAQVAVFENPEFGTVRTATDEKGEPWFCAKDLCDVLGYKRATDAVRQHVRSSDTAKYRIARTVKNRFGVSEGKVQNVLMNFVNESGFYALVLGSKLATAVKFKDWVTSVVLPQIRKTGGYIPVHEGESEEETIRNAEEILRATLKKKEELLEQQKKLLHQQEVQMGLDKKLIGEQDVEIRRLNGVLDEQTRWASIQGENVINLEKQVDGLMPKAIYSDELMLRKNHDYNEAWRDMRISSYTDFTVRHSERLECLSALSNLVEKDIVFQVIEGNLTRSLVHDSTHGCCGNDEIDPSLYIHD